MDNYTLWTKHGEPGVPMEDNEKDNEVTPEAHNESNPATESTTEPATSATGDKEEPVSQKPDEHSNPTEHEEVDKW